MVQFGCEGAVKFKKSQEQGAAAAAARLLPPVLSETVLFGIQPSHSSVNHATKHRT